MKPIRRLLPLLSPFILAVALAAAITALPGYLQTVSAEGDTATWEVQSDCSEVTSGLTRKNSAFDGATNGTCTTPTGATSPAFSVSPEGIAYFDVSSAFMSGNAPYDFARVDIEYFDGPYRSQGDTHFYIQYASQSEDYTAAFPRVYLNNTQRYITATFYLSNVNFNSTQNAGSDFRINLQGADANTLYFRKITVTRSEGSLSPTYTGASYVRFQADNPNGQDLFLVNGGDGHTLSVTNGGRTAAQVSSTGYAYFNVNDAYMYDGNYPYASVEVSYYDQGYGRFYLQFDSNSTLASDTTYALSFNPDLQSNNVVYLTNSLTWKTYTFYLSNVKFANRQMVSLADFRIVYALDSSATVANQGSLLAFDQVTVTRSSTALDRTADLEGNYPGFGDPVVVWTRLAQKNDEGHGLWQNDSVGDGDTTAATKGEQQSRQNSPGGYIYFDIGDGYLNSRNAYNAWISVEYFDNGANPFYIEYDSTSGTKASASVSRTGTNQWKRHTVYVTDGYFGNRMNGGSDFRIASSTLDLYIKRVYVERAPGSYVMPRTQSFPGSTFTGMDKLALVYYLPVFDGYYPNLWETSTMGPPGADSNHIVSSYSWRSIDTIKRDLEDMKAAKIDGLLVWYAGNTNDSTFSTVQMMNNLVQAASQVSNPPKIGLLLDSVHFYHESILKDGDTTLDLTTSTGKSYLFKLAEDFYSLLPSDLWLRVGGRPVINLYYQGQEMVSAYDASSIEHLKQRFATSFGVQPYLIADKLWDPQGSLGVTPDEWFSWGAGIAPASYPGFANNDTMAVGPGFNDGTRVRDREGGNFYTRGWQRAIGKGNHIVLIDTWNYWVEGTAIAESAEYGRSYITATAQYVDLYKSGNYTSTTQASATLGSTNASNGIYQDEMSNAVTTVVSVGGQTGRKATADNMFFSVNDGFLHRGNYGSTVEINVTYFDADAAQGGTDWFAIQFDSRDGAYYPPSITTDNLVDIKSYGNSGAWKTKTFTFSNAYFGNRQNGGNDLVLKSTGGLIVRQVSVTRPAVLSLPNKLFLPLAPRQSSGW